MSPSADTSGGSRSPQRPGTGDGPGREAEQRPASSERVGEIHIPWARGASPTEHPSEEPKGAPRATDTANTAEVTDVADGVEGVDAVGGDVGDALSTTRRERDEYLEMLKRVQADFENYKKRMIRQQTEQLERAAQGIVTKLLPALDAFDLAREHLSDTEQLSDEGKALLQASALLFDALAKEGLERVDDSGKPFDPTVHEAVEHVSTETPGEPTAEEPHSEGPVVVSVLRPGYRWKGRVIRPAMVRVRG